MFRTEKCFGFFNSRWTGIDGEKAEDGEGSVWLADNIEDLCMVIKKTTGSNPSSGYTLDFVDIEELVKGGSERRKTQKHRMQK